MQILKTKAERVASVKTFGGFVLSTGSKEEPLNGQFVLLESGGRWNYTLVSFEYATVFKNREICEIVKAEVERREAWYAAHVYVDPVDHYQKVR